jgi:hypothetical protein
MAVCPRGGRGGVGRRGRVERAGTNPYVRRFALRACATQRTPPEGAVYRGELCGGRRNAARGGAAEVSDLALSAQAKRRDAYLRYGSARSRPAGSFDQAAAARGAAGQIGRPPRGPAQARCHGRRDRSCGRSIAPLSRQRARRVQIVLTRGDCPEGSSDAVLIQGEKRVSWDRYPRVQNE